MSNEGLNKIQQFKMKVVLTQRLIFNLTDPLRHLIDYDWLSSDKISQNRTAVRKELAICHSTINEIQNGICELISHSLDLPIKKEECDEIKESLNFHLKEWKMIFQDLDEALVYFNSEVVDIPDLDDLKIKLKNKIGLKKKWAGDSGEEGGLSFELYKILKGHLRSTKPVEDKIIYKTAQLSDFETPIYHGFKEVKHALTALHNNEILGYTTQRYWDDGKRRKENDPDYKSSFWMKGISLTRDFKFAANWGSIVFVFNRNKLVHNKKIVPFSWNYHINAETDYKKEREEFLITKKTGKTFLNKDTKEFIAEYEELLKNKHQYLEEEFDNLKKHYEKRLNNINVEEIDKPEGSLKNLDEFLEGIFVSSSTLEIYGAEDPAIQETMKHPLFKGFYTR